MSKFGPGDRVRVNSPGDQNHGQRCIVTSHYQRGWYYVDGWPWPLNKRYGWQYETNLDATPARGFDGEEGWVSTYAESQLVPDDYDGNNVAEWSSCAWRPNGILLTGDSDAKP